MCSLYLLFFLPFRVSQHSSQLPGQWVPTVDENFFEMNGDLSHLVSLGRRKEKGSGAIIRCWDLKGKWVSAVILDSYKQQQPG